MDTKKKRGGAKHYNSMTSKCTEERKKKKSKYESFQPLTMRPFRLYRTFFVMGIMLLKKEH
jgi:hypothetical protein